MERHKNWRIVENLDRTNGKLQKNGGFCLQSVLNTKTWKTRLKTQKVHRKRDKAEEQRYKIEEPVCDRGLTQGVWILFEQNEGQSWGKHHATENSVSAVRVLPRKLGEKTVKNKHNCTMEQGSDQRKQHRLEDSICNKSFVNTTELGFGRRGNRQINIMHQEDSVLAERVCHKHLEKKRRRTQKLHGKTGQRRGKTSQTRGSVYSESLLIQGFLTERVEARKHWIVLGKQRGRAEEQRNKIQDFVSAISETMSADPQRGRQVVNSGTAGNLVSTTVLRIGETRLRSQSERRLETTKYFQGSQKNYKNPMVSAKCSWFPTLLPEMRRTAIKFSDWLWNALSFQSRRSRHEKKSTKCPEWLKSFQLPE